MMIIVTQLPLILFVGGKFDLFFGFNRMDSGFTLLVFLFVAVPFLNLSWFITEIIRSVKYSKHQHMAATLLMPLIPVFFLIEALVIDLST